LLNWIKTADWKKVFPYPDYLLKYEAMKRYLKNIFRLRLEEATALVFLVPSALVTFFAYAVFASSERVPRYISGGVWRIAAAIAFFVIIYFSARLKHKSKIILFIREVLPFVLVIAVYTNLHDTIAFVNSGNIAPFLIKLDKLIFGVNPVLWAEKFYNPILTEIFSFCYLNFFWYSFTLGLLLYFGKNYNEFRTAMIGIVLLFYAGYFLYIIFPTIPPRIMLKPYFTKHLDGAFITKLSDRIVNVSFATSRAAFPSLHCGNTLLTLIYAFKYKRPYFYIFLPIGIGLILGTVYLRHHYVVDIFAGFALAIIVFFAAPKITRQWQKWRDSVISKPADNML